MKIKLTEKAVKALDPVDKPFRVWDTEQPGLFLRIQPSGRKVFVVSYRNNGRKTDHTIGQWGIVTLAQARDLAKAALGKVATGTDPQQERKAARVAAECARKEAERTKQQTLGTFLDEHYAPWLIRERRSGAATQARIRNCFAEWLDLSMPTLTPWLVEKWKAKRLQSGIRAATINRDLVALKAMLTKAVEWQVIDTHPLAQVKPLKLDTKGRVRYLSEVEERRLRKALTDRETRVRTERVSGNQWRAERSLELFPDLSDVAFVDHLQPMVLLVMNTGLRRGELFNLQWPDIDLITRVLTVEGSGSKSGQTRHIPLNNEAVDVLTRWKAQSTGQGYVFPAVDGGRLTDIKTAFSRLLESAQIDAFRFHDFRHHFASRLVMAGVDLNTVRELLGHANLDMTLRYAHLAPEHKAAAVALLNQAAS